ncbi:unnamed protein product [Polarella glacialis]|uniref:Smr domain-containing protein n=2 Tax=Polarella glacialis TaxID=89957 RepID=A0A813F5W9_POLGL|nr:unnamed protein product [Polarella glacialis]
MGEVGRALELYRKAMAHGLLTPWCKEPGVLDLHGHTVQVALTAARAVLADLLARPDGRYCHDPAHDLILITGRGSRSEASEQQLLPALAAFLKEELQPPMEFLPHSSNPGRWIIPGSCLTRWAEAQRNNA